MCTIEDLLEWFSEEDQLLAASEPISCQPQRLQKQLAEQKVLEWKLFCSLICATVIRNVFAL